MGCVCVKDHDLLVMSCSDRQEERVHPFPDRRKLGFKEGDEPSSQLYMQRITPAAEGCHDIVPVPKGISLSIVPDAFQRRPVNVLQVQGDFVFRALALRYPKSYLAWYGQRHIKGICFIDITI